MSKPIEQFTARFRVTTPLFAGGATQEVELRVPSFKGLLRFWWRALPVQARRSCDELAEAEAALFGSASSGQSRVRLRFEGPDVPRPLSTGKRLNRDGSGSGSDGDVVGPGARYLGYGLMQAFPSSKSGVEAGELSRPCLTAPFELLLHVRLSPEVSREQALELQNALIAMGTLGGLGSRMRRGYGSLSLVALERARELVWPPDGGKFEVAFKTWFQKQRKRPAGGSELPQWTALSPHAQAVLLRGEKGESALSLLDRVGKEMVRYRSWGMSQGSSDEPGRILGQEGSEQNFRDDHDLMKKKPFKRDAHPRRVAFGLPHNYGKGADQQVGPAQQKLDRRASPLFLHIHQTDDESPPVAVVSFLPARFLPGENPQISVGGKPVPMRPEDELYEPVRRFLVRLAGKDEGKPGGRRKESFAQTTSIGLDDGSGDNDRDRGGAA